MGQYYKIINNDLSSVLTPSRFKNGSKLTEHSWVGNRVVNTVCNLLLENNRWYKTRLVWSGDYSGEEFTEEYEHIKKAYRDKFEAENKGAKYGYDLNLYTISNIAKFNMVIDVEIDYNNIQYGFNESKKEYYDLNDCPKAGDEWTLHPLPLLLCTGNGQGGGDYFGNAGKEYIGTWANDIIFTSNELPSNISDYTKITPGFIE